jgi:hypothetical protein
MNSCNAEVPAADLQLKIRIGETMANIAEVNDTTFELLFYNNHLDWELGGAQQAFILASGTPRFNT